MLVIHKIAFCVFAAITLHQAAGQNQPSASVHKSSTSFVTIKEGDSPDAALLKHQDSQSATSYQYVRRSGGSSRVEGIQSQGRIDTPTGHSSGSYRYSTKNTYTSSTQTGGEGKQYVQQTRQSSYGKKQTPGVHQSATSFLEIKEGGTDDSALLQQQGSQSATSYQFVSQSQGGSQQSGSRAASQQQATRSENRCTPCTVDGNTYKGHSRFEYTSGCYKMRCICNCDGSYDCPPQNTIKVCENEQRTRDRQQQSSNTKYNQSMGNRGEYSHQMATGHRGSQRVFAKMEYVATPDSGVQSREDGHDRQRQQQLEQRRSEMERRQQESERRSRPSGDMCSPCTINGTTFKGHSRFEYTSGCYKKRCICSCDGTYSCPSQHTINICSVEKRKENRQQQAQSKGCTPCVVNGTSYRGHSRFEYTSGCFKKRCICHCDGSHTCPSHHVVNVCKQMERDRDRDRDRFQQGRTTCSTCSAKGKIVNGNSYFDLRDGCTQYKNCICHCNGTWSCSPNSAENVCVTPENEPVCRECEVYGSFYPGNSKFKYEEGCYEYNCDCNCDGSWVCPPNKTKDLCQTGCGECEVQGEFFEGNSYFRQERGCIEYKCFCRCNGTWNCPSDQARNVCRSEGDAACSKCHVSASETHPGNSTFELRIGCIHYQCTCNCDGSWDCPGQLSKNVCKGELPGKCVNCQVADNEFYPGDSDFEMRKDCIHYQCRCHCDGSWECPGEKARDVCKGEVPGGCKSCRLSDTEFYRGDTDFEMRRGCIHYKCRCKCDGSWNCPGEEARNICLGEVPGGCRSCKVDNETSYPGNSRFQLTRDCNRYDCVCRCNGSWSCPGNTAVNVCDRKPDSKDPATCRDCVLDGKSYKGGMNFQLTRGCYAYQCKCACDGKWTCDTNNAQDICSQPTSPTQQCGSCVVNGKEYAGGSDFRIRRGCISYHCRCACDGRWECPSNRASNFCPGAREPTESCKPCIVDEKNYKAGENFDMKRGCVRYRCRCRCDGSYGCHVTEDTACGAGELPAKCGNCVIDGYVYPGNMGFLTRNGCIQKACQCNCDGTYDCPPNAIQNICTGEASIQNPGSQSLGQAGTQSKTQGRNMGSSQYAGSNHMLVYTAGGKRVVDQGQYISPIGPNGTQRIVANAGGQYFVPYHGPRYVLPGAKTGQYYYQGGKQFIPSGSREFYSKNIVPPNTVHTQTVHTQRNSGINRRPLPPLPRGSQTYVQSREYPAASTGCQSCTIEGNVYPGNSNFQITKKCIQYQCRCECTGMWTCSGEYSWSCTPRNGPLSGDCRSCVVKDVEYPPNHTFTLQQGCSEYECQCNCDGRWFCPTQKPTDICGPNAPQHEQPSTCHNCHVKDTEYPTDSEFFLNENCKQYTCTCLCDGSWICPESKTIDICNKQHKGKVDTQTSPLKDTKPTCTPCHVNGKSYMPSKDFQFREGCSQYKCHCFCNGTWECPANKTVNVCRSPDYRIDGCKSCLVQNETYPGGTAFRYREGCWEFNCFCACNGEWDCPPGRSTDLCKSTGGVSSRCRPCIINGKVIKSKSVFNMRRGCSEFLCDCMCDGSHTCPPERSLNVCEEGRQSIDPNVKSNFKGCEIGARTFYTRLFVYTEDCIQYMCICYDNGAWKCPPQKSRRVC